jgi:hypothetical protein
MGRLKEVLLAGVLLVGCAGSEAPETTYLYWAERTAAAMCTWAEQCGGATAPYEQCVAGIIDAYSAVEPELDRALAGAKQGCVQCMRIRGGELKASLESGCARSPDEARVRAVCGAEDEACAGAP